MCRLILGLLVLLICGNVWAADISWDDITGGLFSDSANWNPVQVPTSGDNAIFDLSIAGYMVTFDDNETSKRLIINTDVVKFDLGGFTYTLDGADTVNRGVTIGDVATDVADLSITNGILNSQYAVMGNASGATGTVTVNGIGSTWTNSSNLFVGRNGSGTLTILGGGEVSNDFGFVGNNVASNGTVTVDGVGSTWTNSSWLNIGNIGTGSLNIQNGGTVSNTVGIVGNQALWLRSSAAATVVRTSSPPIVRQ